MTDYDKLVKALRILQDKNSLSYYKRQVCKDAADAIEALQAELEKKRTADCFGCKCEKLEPKRGEWIHVEGDEPWEWRCTACHKIAEGLGEFRFCPNCGAKMEVQDGTD
jgi:rubrerythrin